MLLFKALFPGLLQESSFVGASWETREDIASTEM